MIPNKYLAKSVWAPQIKNLFQHQLHELIYTNKAHGMMLVRQGLLGLEDYRVIATGLDTVESFLKEQDLQGELGDLYFNVMQRLYDTIGRDVGCKVHLGRSRNDICGACNRLQVRREVLSLIERVNHVMDEILCVAEKHKNSIITYNTYGQPAQPGTFGHYLMLAFQQLHRDFVRLKAAYCNVNLSPTGASAGIGTSFPLDRTYMAELLGFDGIVEHTLDAVSSVDYILECEAAVSIMMVNMSRLAQDLFNWSSYEYKLLELDDSITVGSSIMPQKKNPVCFEHMRSQSARAVGMFADAVAMVRNTTMFPCTEGSVDIFCDFSIWMEEAAKTLELLDIGLKNTVLNEELACQSTRDNYTSASSMAEHLARTYSIPFIDAHHIVHDTILRHMETHNASASTLKSELLEEVSRNYLKEPIHLKDEDVQKLIDPMYCLREIAVDGSPKPDNTERMIQEGYNILDGQKSWLNETCSKLRMAEEKVKNGI